MLSQHYLDSSMSRPTLSLFRGNRPSDTARPLKDCSSGLTPVERSMADAMKQGRQ
jgi:hypothetical protein